MTEIFGHLMSVALEPWRLILGGRRGALVDAILFIFPAPHPPQPFTPSHPGGNGNMLFPPQCIGQQP